MSEDIAIDPSLSRPPSPPLPSSSHHSKAAPFPIPSHISLPTPSRATSVVSDLTPLASPALSPTTSTPVPTSRPSSSAGLALPVANGSSLGLSPQPASIPVASTSTGLQPDTSQKIPYRSRSTDIPIITHAPSTYYQPPPARSNSHSTDIPVTPLPPLTNSIPVPQPPLQPIPNNLKRKPEDTAPRSSRESTAVAAKCPYRDSRKCRKEYKTVNAMRAHLEQAHPHEPDFQQSLDRFMPQPSTKKAKTSNGGFIQQRKTANNTYDSSDNIAVPQLLPTPRMHNAGLPLPQDQYRQQQEQQELQRQQQIQQQQQQQLLLQQQQQQERLEREKRERAQAAQQAAAAAAQAQQVLQPLPHARQRGTPGPSGSRAQSRPQSKAPSASAAPGTTAQAQSANTAAATAAPNPFFGLFTHGYVFTSAGLPFRPHDRPIDALYYLNILSTAGIKSHQQRASERLMVNALLNGDFVRELQDSANEHIVTQMHTDFETHCQQALNLFDGASMLKQPDIPIHPVYRVPTPAIPYTKLDADSAILKLAKTLQEVGLGDAIDDTQYL